MSALIGDLEKKNGEIWNRSRSGLFAVLLRNWTLIQNIYTSYSTIKPKSSFL